MRPLSARSLCQRPTAGSPYPRGLARHALTSALVVGLWSAPALAQQQAPELAPAEAQETTAARGDWGTPSDAPRAPSAPDTALAGLAVPDMPLPPATPGESAATADASHRSDRFALVWRSRAIKFPDALLGIWFERHGSHWSGDQANWSHGVEFTWRLEDYEVALGLDHADLGMAPSFWQESGEGPRDAKWTEVTLRVWSLAISTQRVWQPLDWLSPYVGGGVGAGILLGDMFKYAPRRDSACYAGLGQSNVLNPPQCFTASGEPSSEAFDVANPEREDALPGVVPVLHLGTGLRARVLDHGVLKIEAGFQNYLYAGLALGGQW